MRSLLFAIILAAVACDHNHVDKSTGGTVPAGSTHLVYFGDAITNLCFAYFWQENDLLDYRAGGPGLTWVPCSIAVCKQIADAAELSGYRPI